MRLPAAPLLLPLAFLLTAAAADPTPEPDDDNDAKTIVGTWEAVKGSKEGKPAPAKEIAGLKMTFTKDSLTVQEPNRAGRGEVASYKLNPKAKPRQFDLTLNQPGGNRVLTIHGIYKIEKGQMTFCFTKDGGARPTGFDEKTYTVLVLRKEKAKK